MKKQASITKKNKKTKPEYAFKLSRVNYKKNQANKGEGRETTKEPTNSSLNSYQTERRNRAKYIHTYRSGQPDIISFVEGKSLERYQRRLREMLGKKSFENHFDIISFAINYANMKNKHI